MSDKNTYKIKLRNTFEFLPEIKWVLTVFSSYVDCAFNFVEEDEACDIDLSLENGPLIYNAIFYNFCYSHPEKSVDLLGESMDIISPDGRTDFISTAFYFLNCLWETDTRSIKDHWGRSEFEGSIWEKHGFAQPFLKVNECFDAFAQIVKIPQVKRKSRVYLSHDIDVVFGAFKEDGYVLFKKRKFISLVSYVWSHFFSGPQWFNFRKIAAIEQKYSMSSTFFWIPIKGKVKGIGKNADYAISDQRIKAEIEWLTTRGFSQGLHKSLSTTSIKQELNMLGFEVLSNRYHYLKFSFNQLKNEMNDSGLKLDASLGYAQASGYRNGYSLPFVPFDLEKRCPCSFIEVPLSLMDGTYSKYKKMNGQRALTEMLDFIDRNSDNSVLSILWHNSHFTDVKYEGFTDAYEALLAHLKHSGIEVITTKELVEEFNHVYF